jgi:SagB-type dehydrogenase family enzyme
MFDASERLARVHHYHDGTKHYFHRFARSTGYLDWASQPRPFRSFAGTSSVVLAPRPDAPPLASTGMAALVGNILRESLGLSAWKAFGDSRWSLRVNPSSGNLHPTEAYVVAGPTAGLADVPAVYHYAADHHTLELRATLAADAWRDGMADPDVWFVALTSIHWRESWKYGERAFRYCQHDCGHAIAAVGFAAALAGCRASLLPEWSHDDIAAVTGIDRDEDYVEAEREEPAAILSIRRTTPAMDGQSPASSREPLVVRPAWLVAAARDGAWSGQASQLSEDHVRWTFIDEIAAATRDSGRERISSPLVPSISSADTHAVHLPSREVVLGRRSALGFDGEATIDEVAFVATLAHTMPADGAPWDALWWAPRIHLALFVHRVRGVTPGLYMLVRDPAAVDRLKIACGREFLWRQVGSSLPLFLLAAGDCRSLAQRLSCDQAIAADGFFSLGMIADFDQSLTTFGPSFYRHLFWESGIVGQVLYLNAESSGARGTGIGCFYDDPVHDALGLTGHSFQSVYHFTIGMPVDDLRLTTEPGYDWEARTRSGDQRPGPSISSSPMSNAPAIRRVFCE